MTNLRMATDIPAGIRSPQSPSMLPTDRQFPGLYGMRSGAAESADGSLDLYFAATAPGGRERNWIQTIPGKGFMAILRIFGPSEAWFEQTWRPGEITEL